MEKKVDLKELERYTRVYQENPDSRVFAPLADMYRRLGRLVEAEEVCREGIERHPYYAGGKVALAHVLLDQNRFDEALREAEVVVTYYPDNLLARKILIRALGSLGKKERAAREFQILKQISPQVASDPQLERVVVAGQSTDDDALVDHQQLLSSSKGGDSLFDGGDGAEHRSKRLAGLYRKKLFLETFIKHLNPSS